MAEKEKGFREKVLREAKLLEEAKRILRRHQRNRDVCTKKLLVAHYRVLLQDLGAGDKVKHVLDGKSTNVPRPGLIQAYWEMHVDQPESPGNFIT